MTETPGNFADPPEPLVRSDYGKRDALSDVLQKIHLRGGEVVHSHDTTVRYPAGARLVHLVEQGEVRADLPDGPVELVASDMVLLARFVVRGTQEGTRWLPLSLSLMRAKVTEPQPGTRVMVARLLDLLFIRALRFWAVSGRQADPGWLTAALDPVLSPVLSAIHRAPGRNWQVDELAKLAALSRSAFATRFTEVVGQTPGAYVLRQRLDHAARLLLTTTEPVGRIAAGVGYSEAAFSRAFTRAYGRSPRAWRASVRSREAARTSARP